MRNETLTTYNTKLKTIDSRSKIIPQAEVLISKSLTQF